MTEPTPSLSSEGATRLKPTEELSRAEPLSLTVDHHHLIDIDTASIRRFPRNLYQYGNFVLSPAQKVSCVEVSKELFRLVDIKFCVDVDLLESFIHLGNVPDANSYETITASQVHVFLVRRGQ